MKDVLIHNDIRKTYDKYSGWATPISPLEAVDQINKEEMSIVDEGNWPHTVFTYLTLAGTQHKIKLYLKLEDIETVLLMGEDKDQHTNLIGIAVKTADVDRYMMKLHTIPSIDCDIMANTLQGIHLAALNFPVQDYNRDLDPVNNYADPDNGERRYTNLEEPTYSILPPIMAVRIPSTTDYLTAYAAFHNLTISSTSLLWDWIRADGTHDGITIFRVFTDDLGVYATVFSLYKYTSKLGNFSWNNSSYQKVFNVEGVKRVIEFSGRTANGRPT